MAKLNTINDMRQSTWNGVIDQNGHYKRNPDGSIATDDNGRPISKAGIKPTAGQLTPRLPGTPERVYTDKGPFHKGPDAAGIVDTTAMPDPVLNPGGPKYPDEKGEVKATPSAPAGGSDPDPDPDD